MKRSVLCAVAGSALLVGLGPVAAQAAPTTGQAAAHQASAHQGSHDRVAAHHVGTPRTVGASSATRRAITAAIVHSPFTRQVPSNRYDVRGVKLSSNDRRWATATLHSHSRNLDSATGVLKRSGSQWKLVQLGTYEVGCDVAPRGVLQDFGTVCH